MNSQFSPPLFDSISSLLKVAIYPEQNSEHLKIEYIHSILDDIFKEASKEAEKNYEEENFDEVAYFFMLISEALTRVAPFLKNTNASALLKEVGEQWLSRADSMIRKVANLYNDQALIFNINAEFSKASEYKNKADNLRYNIRRRAATELLKILDATRNIMVDAPRYADVLDKTEISSIIPSSTSNKVLSIISPEDIKITNNSRPMPSMSGWYDWAVYLDVSDNVLSQIKSITYTLHPTFAEPMKEVRDPRSRFELRGRSWGEFEIKADVHLHDGNIITKYYWLKLGS